MYRATVTMPQPEEPVRTRTRARGTRQAQALAAALERLPGFCSAQEIHAELRRKGEHVGLATVYRHLAVDIHKEYLDHTGRPRPVLPSGAPIQELF